MDFVLPQNNEQELLARAKELNLELCFLYPAEEFHQKKFYPKGLLIQANAIKDLNQLQRFRNNKNCHLEGQFLNCKRPKGLSFNPVVRNEKIFLASQNEDVLKSALSRKGIFAITRVCSSSGREHTHYRRAGLNQALAKLAYENEIAYYIDFSEILNSSGKQRELLLGRIKQNIFLCEKYKVRVEIASFASKPEEMRSEKDLDGFLRVLRKTKI